MIGTLANNTLEVLNSTSDKNTITEENVFAKIKYIIQTKGVQIASVFDKDEKEKSEQEYTYNCWNDNTYQFANESDVIRVTLTGETPAGYLFKGLQAGKYAEISLNDDGSFSVLVKCGGDLNLEALFEKIPVYEEPDFYVGRKISLNSSDWIITGIDKENEIWSLSCIDSLTEKEMNDLTGTLKSILTSGQMNHVIAEANDELCGLADQEVADRFFHGDVNHLSIRCDMNICSEQ